MPRLSPATAVILYASYCIVCLPITQSVDASTDTSTSNNQQVGQDNAEHRNAPPDDTEHPDISTGDIEHHDVSKDDIEHHDVPTTGSTTHVPTNARSQEDPTSNEVLQTVPSNVLADIIPEHPVLADTISENSISTKDRDIPRRIVKLNHRLNWTTLNN